MVGRSDPARSARREKLFHGLAEPSRLAILACLRGGPLNVSEIADRAALSQPNTSNHLACLLGCGLVRREREGRFTYYRLADEDVATLLAVADRIVTHTAPDLLACPRCGTTRI
ncbi:metalloregulator ArsR/SmtB family transcription factor [Gaopeijia maritima]|uniref:ArsR/SmtB family transcription factor n=1 Tax=Gaopeijia maritima TaxID=3119007 RepID=UPI003252C068